MHYFTTSAFDQSVGKLSESRKKQVKKTVRLAVAFFETGDLPHGLGFKPLGHELWEIRAGLSERIVFRKSKETVEFLLAGSHDEIRRFLKNL